MPRVTASLPHVWAPPRASRRLLAAQRAPPARAAPTPPPLAGHPVSRLGLLRRNTLFFTMDFIASFNLAPVAPAKNLGAIINRIDALPDVLQQHLAYRTPICSGSSQQGDFRTISFISDQLSPVKVPPCLLESYCNSMTKSRRLWAPCVAAVSANESTFMCLEASLKFCARN